MDEGDGRTAARGILDRRRRERDGLLERALAFAEGLDPALGVRAAVVFGSVARGDFNVWSDIDLLVVADELPERPQDRAAAMGAAPRVSVVAWTPAELRRQSEAANPIAREALASGVLVLGVPLDGLLAG